MSEPDVMVEDETPPPDIVAQPARSRGAYKLCMECGQNVLRYSYRAGSSVCKACEAKAQPLVEAAPVVPELIEASFPVQEETADEAQPEQPAGAAVTGTLEARDWLAATCGVRTPELLTLDVITTTLRALLAEKAHLIGRVTRYGTQAGPVRPEDVPLETAAKALWMACDPVVQERLDAAVEVLRYPLNQVILGNLAYHEQELLDQDMSIVPKISYAAQYGTGVGGASARAPHGSPSAFPGGRVVDDEGRLVKNCLCCGRVFHPPPSRPNPDFCDNDCGNFAEAIRIWATNKINDDVYGRDPNPAPLPEPEMVWPRERRVEPYISHALQFRERRVQEKLDAAREQHEKMRGLG